MSLIKFGCSPVLPELHPKMHQNWRTFGILGYDQELLSFEFPLLHSKIKMKGIAVLMTASFLILSQNTLGEIFQVQSITCLKLLQFFS